MSWRCGSSSRVSCFASVDGVSKISQLSLISPASGTGADDLFIH
jgi:hypothetical protein